MQLRGRLAVLGLALLLVVPAASVTAAQPPWRLLDTLHIVGPSSAEPLRGVLRPAVHFNGECQGPAPLFEPVEDLTGINVNPAQSLGIDGVGGAEVDFSGDTNGRFLVEIETRPDPAAGDPVGSVSLGFYEPGPECGPQTEPTCIGEEANGGNGDGDLCYGPGRAFEGKVKSPKALVWLWDAPEAFVRVYVRT